MAILPLKVGYTTISHCVENFVYQFRPDCKGVADQTRLITQVLLSIFDVNTRYFEFGEAWFYLPRLTYLSSNRSNSRILLC